MKNTSKITIRKAKAEDLNYILQLNFELFKKEYEDYDRSLNLKWTLGREGKKYFKARILENDGFVVVAEIDKEAVGYLCGGLHKCSYRIIKKYAELENMIVIKKYRQKGIGKRLVKEFLKWCNTKKISHVSVTAYAKNIEGLKFYRSLGFDDCTLTLEKKI